MSKNYKKYIKVFLILVLLVSMAGYFYFYYIPKSRTLNIIEKFEIAVRRNDKITLREIVSSSDYWDRLESGIFQEYFGYFYNGVEITRVHIRPIVNNTRIWTEGRMKAKIDGKYRNHFEFCIILENGKWKLRQFYFPDIVDYK